MKGLLTINSRTAVLAIPVGAGTFDFVLAQVESTGYHGSPRARRTGQRLTELERHTVTIPQKLHSRPGGESIRQIRKVCAILREAERLNARIEVS